MRKRQLKWLWARLAQITAMTLTREAMLMKLGSAKTKAPAAWRLIAIAIDKDGPGFSYRLDRDKLRRVRRREGRYLLRTTLAESDPVKLWTYPNLRRIDMRDVTNQWVSRKVGTTRARGFGDQALRASGSASARRMRLGSTMPRRSRRAAWAGSGWARRTWKARSRWRTAARSRSSRLQTMSGWS